MKSHLVVFSALAALTLSASPSRAANATWNGTTDGIWATDGNWTAAAPGTGETATFNNAGNSNVVLNLGAGVIVSTILFDTASAAGYTIGSGAVGSQTLTLNANGRLTVNSAVTNDQLINANVVLGTANGNQSFTFTNGSTTNDLTIAGGISSVTTGNKTLTVTGAGDTLISGTITNGAGAVILTKTGTGKLTLTGANTNTGTVNVSGAGTLALDFSAAGAPATNIIGGNALSINNSLLEITLSNGATANTQAFASTTFAGGGIEYRVIQNGNTNAASGVALGGLTRANNSTVDFTLPTTGSITTTSTTAFIGTNRVLSAGSVAYATSQGMDWVTNTVGGILGTTAGLYSNDVFAASSDVNITTSIAPAAFTVNTLRFNTADVTLTLNNSGASTVTAGGILVTANGTGSVIAGAGPGASLQAGAAADQIVIHNYADLTVSAVIADNGQANSLVLAGTGITTLTGANTYTGATTVNGGTLTLGPGGTIATSSGLTVNGGTFFLTGANDLANFTSTVNASNGLTFTNGVGTVNLGGLAGSSTGSIALTDTGANNVNLQIGANNATTSYLGTLSGGGDIIKVGTGTSTFGGLDGSGFSGDIFIREGTILANGGTGNTTQLGTGIIYLGADGGSADAQLTYGNAGATPTLSNTIMVENGSGARTLFYNSTSGGTSQTGGIVLDNDLEIRRTGGGGFSINGGITGTGDVLLTTTGAQPTGTSAINIGGSNPVNMVGSLTNQAEVGTVTVSTSIGANVTSIVQSGSATMLLSGNNSAFVGDVDITLGNLRVSNADGLNANNTVDIASSGTFTVANGTTNLTIAGLNGSGTVTKEGGNNRTLTLGGSGTYASSATLTEIAGGVLNIVKTGNGTQTFSGVGVYTGSTTVTAGTLLIDGSIGGSGVTVSGAGTLGGIGEINAATVINSGGILSPGNSPGTLIFNNALTLNNNSTYFFEAGDLVDVNGTLDLNATWTLSLNGNDFVDGGSIVLFTFDTLAVDPFLDPTIVNNMGFTPTDDLTLSIVGNSVVLHGVSMVPEPSTLGLIGLGLLVLRRRRKA